MIDKLRDCFDQMVVFKDLKKSNFFLSFGLPSFLRDWVLCQFEDEEGNYDTRRVDDFITRYLPKENDWNSIKNRIVYEHERVKLLTKICVDIDIKSGEISFSLPKLRLNKNETLIEPHVWEEYKTELVNGQEIWGVVELGYRDPDENARPKIPGKVKLTGFKNFCPYTINIDYFKDVRNEFSITEWIDVILGAIDYNANGYENEDTKLTMLTRLLPFIEKRLNLLELAPKGTGKSYVFGNISKYGLLTNAKITRSSMFYNMSSGAPGFICGKDYVAIDEVKHLTFSDVDEMRSILQGYMERGTFNVAGYDGESSAGVVLLGNIMQSQMNESQSMLDELPDLFKESALMDRIHGFIKGWDIPEMDDKFKVAGWALNSEYFCSIMHMLRDDASYRSIVDQIVTVSDRAYVRHSEAVKRIATAYLKLFFPNVRTVNDVNLEQFKRYCLDPATKMRGIIWKQLAILDPEYMKQKKTMPTFDLRKV